MMLRVGSALRLSFVVVFVFIAQVSASSEQEMLREKGIRLCDLLGRMRSTSGESMWACDYVAYDQAAVAGIDTDDAAKFRRAIDLLPGYEWLEGTMSDGSKFHVLGPDWEERAVWDKLGARDKARKRAEIHEAYRKRLQETFDALSLSKEELAKLIDDDPNLVSALRSPFRRQAILFLAGLPEKQLQGLFQRPMEVALLGLPPEFRAMIVGDTGEDLSAADHVSFQLGEGFEISMHQPSGGHGNGNFLLPRTLYAAETRRGLRDTSGMSEEEAEELYRQDKETWRHRIREERDAEAKKRIEQSPPRFGTRAAVPEGTLEATLETKQAYNSLQDLCDKKKLVLVSQYFRRHDEWLPLPLSAGTGLPAALDLIAEVADSVWAYEDGSTVLLAGRQFMYDLFGGSLGYLVVRWRKRAAMRGGILALDDLAEIATSELSDDHIRDLPRDLRRAGAIFAWASRPDLRFYSSLRSNQRAAAWRKDGLAYSKLSIVQRRLFDAAMSVRLEVIRLEAKYGDPDASPVSFRISHRGDVIRFVYSFSSGPPWIDSVRRPRSSKSDAKNSISSAPAELSSPGGKAAVALAKWTYAGWQSRDGRVRARLRTGIGDWKKGYLVPVGAEFEGAKLVDIGRKRLTFRLDDGTEIRMPVARSVSVPPYEIPAQ